MSLRDPYRRRRSPAWRWLAIVVLLAAGAALGVVGWRLWQRSVDDAAAAANDEIVAQVEALRGELQQATDRLSAAESRLAALEGGDTADRLAALEDAVDGLRGDMATLGQRLASVPPAVPAALPPEVHLAVARQVQSHSLSCESSASSMAAQYKGVDLSESDILASLPRNANPHLGFRGNIDGPTGGIEDYGVYAEPVVAVLNSRGLKASLVDGGLDGIKAALARGNPVVAWVTYNCIASTPVKIDIDGQAVTLVPYQHAVVVMGYDDGGVWANDPYDGQEDYYSTADFERGLGYFGDMAIEVAGP